MDQGPVIWLTFFTLISGLVVVGGSFMYFLRRRQNREIASDVILGDGKPKPFNLHDGVLPELLGLLLIALGVMALLALGYSFR